MARLLALAVLGADEKPAESATVKFSVSGLFCVEREDDLREAAAKMPDVKLVSIDFQNSEATFSYDSRKTPKNPKPEQVLQFIDNQLKQASNHTFGVKPRCANRDQLTRVEIHVGILDCKACGLGVYWMVTKVAGVEQATVSIKDGLVTAWIDPAQTNRAALVTALKAREVHVKDP